jgi:hypothetical protein
MNQEETHKTEEVSSEAPTPGVESRSEKSNAIVIPMPNDWSWGGFMFAPAYLIAVKKYKYLLLYLLGLAPLINVIAMIGISIFVGLKGRSFVAESDMFKNDDEREGFNRAIDHAGWIMFLVTLVGFVLSLLFAGLLIAFLASIFGGPHMFR